MRAVVLMATAGALASAVVLRRLLRSRRWLKRPPAPMQCACCTASSTRGLTTPSKRNRTAVASDEDSTPTRPERLNSDPDAATKRTSHLTWDEYFMAVAFLSAQRSKDPNRQVGACVVNGDRKIVGIGYNGFPWGCADDQLPWAKKGETALDTKYPYVCHAELNAIMNANSKTLRGCTIYVTLFPCNECAKLIIQARISRVLFYSDMYHDTISTHASKRMLDLAGVETHRFTQLCPTARQSVTLDFAGMC